MKISKKIFLVFIFISCLVLTFSEKIENEIEYLENKFDSLKNINFPNRELSAQTPILSVSPYNKTIFQKLIYQRFVPEITTKPSYHRIVQAQSESEELLIDVNECDYGNDFQLLLYRDCNTDFTCSSQKYIFKNNEPKYEMLLKYFLTTSGYFTDLTSEKYYLIWSINTTDMFDSKLKIIEYNLSIFFTKAIFENKKLDFTGIGDNYILGNKNSLYFNMSDDNKNKYFYDESDSNPNNLNKIFPFGNRLPTEIS